MTINSSQYEPGLSAFFYEIDASLGGPLTAKLVFLLLALFMLTGNQSKGVLGQVGRQAGSEPIIDDDQDPDTGLAEVQLNHLMCIRKGQLQSYINLSRVCSYLFMEITIILIWYIIDKNQ